MDFFATEAFIRLANVNHKPCISLYMPLTQPDEAGEKENCKAFKALVAKVEQQLIGKHLKKSFINDLLSQVWELTEDKHFRSNHSDSLAVFIAPDFYMHYTLPLPCDTTMVISNKLYLAPLLPLIINEQYYYILTLDTDSVDLFEANPYSITPIEVNDIVPPHLKNTLRDIEGATLEEYLQLVDNDICPLLKQEYAPLVLAGNKEVVAEFKRLSRCKMIIDDIIEADVANISLTELHNRAKAIVQPHFSELAMVACERFEEISDGDHSSSDLKEVVINSHLKKVDTLLIKKQAEVWGDIDLTNQEVSLYNQRQGTELINQAAIQTILHGGKVFMLDCDMPGKGEVAAIYRQKGKL